jgi:hypothetical protein
MDETLFLEPSLQKKELLIPYEEFELFNDLDEASQNEMRVYLDNIRTRFFIKYIKGLLQFENGKTSIARSDIPFVLGEMQNPMRYLSDKHDNMERLNKTLESNIVTYNSGTKLSNKFEYIVINFLNKIMDDVLKIERKIK